MPKTDTITLVVVSDDHYVILLAALIRSIEENLSAGINLDLWIISDGVTDEHKAKMNASVNPGISSLHWHNIEDVVQGAALPKDRSSYPLNIYARLFIPYFIPESIEKVLYLDVDMIVLEDLSKLWKTDITDHVLAAVLDSRVQTFDNSWGGIINYKQLGLQAKSEYFNTGLLLINTKMWRVKNVTEQIFDVIGKNLKYANYPDQYGLNIVMADGWKHLDAGWNHFATVADGTPHIIHFVDRKPIYRAYKNSRKYLDLFNKYLNGTAWRNTKPIGEAARHLKKIKNILAKINIRL